MQFQTVYPPIITISHDPITIISSKTNLVKSLFFITNRDVSSLAEESTHHGETSGAKIGLSPLPCWFTVAESSTPQGTAVVAKGESKTLCRLEQRSPWLFAGSTNVIHHPNPWFSTTSNDTPVISHMQNSGSEGPFGDGSTGSETRKHQGTTSRNQY